MAAPVLERLKYCPECKEKNIISPLESLQYEEDRFWMFCTRGNGCSFLEEFMGKAVVTKEDLIMYGLPGQLIEHMDIFYEDINKIVRLCMYEYIKVKYLENPLMNIDLETIKDSIRILAESHDLNSFSAPTEVLQTDGTQITASENLNGSQITANEDLNGMSQFGKSDFSANKDLLRTVDDPHLSGVPSLHSQSTEPLKNDLKTKEEVLVSQAGLPDFASVSQTSEIAPVEDLEQLFQSLVGEPLKPLDIKDGESTEEHKLCNLKKVKKRLQSPRSLNPYDPVKKLADSLVADLPILYQENVKAAFSKIEGYNFPFDFAHND